MALIKIQKSIDQASNDPKGFHRWRNTQAAVAAVEFAMAMPVFILAFVGLVDLGRLVLLQMRLDADTAAASNYAAANASLVNSTSAPSLASLIAQAMGGNLSATLNSGKVIVNNGSTGTVTNGTVAISGDASTADVCYCPTGSSSPWTWGSSVTCGSTCSTGLLAGKFVSITETQIFSPIFSAYSFTRSNQISATAMVRTQ